MIKKDKIIRECYFCDYKSGGEKSNRIMLTNKNSGDRWGICSSCIKNAVSQLIKLTEENINND